MVDALIIDACRTPRGIGKVGKGALAEHPSAAARRATVLKAIAERNDLNTAEVDDIIWGTSRSAAQQSGDLGRMAALDAGYRRAGQRRDARSLLRLGHHQRQHRRRLDHVGHGGPRDRRRHRDDVDAEGRRARGRPR